MLDLNQYHELLKKAEESFRIAYASDPAYLSGITFHLNRNQLGATKKLVKAHWNKLLECHPTIADWLLHNKLIEK